MQIDNLRFFFFGQLLSCGIENVWLTWIRLRFRRPLQVPALGSGPVDRGGSRSNDDVSARFAVGCRRSVRGRPVRYFDTGKSTPFFRIGRSSAAYRVCTGTRARSQCAVLFFICSRARGNPTVLVRTGGWGNKKELEKNYVERGKRKKKKTNPTGKTNRYGNRAANA